MIRDKISFLLSNIPFILLYIVLLILSIGVNFARDQDPKSYLKYYKIFFYVHAFMTIWAQIKCSKTNPGKVVHELNPFVVSFYLNTREDAITRASKLNLSYSEMILEQITKEAYNSNQNVDSDSKEYPVITSIQDNAMENLEIEHKIKLNRCNYCYVVRVPGAKHCSRCQGCILKKDRHYPWVNNCIGQFNQKFFLQFIFYSFMTLCEATIIALYYVYYKDKVHFHCDNQTYIFYIIMILLIFICLIFDVHMIEEQWLSIKNDTTVIDFEKKEFVEKRIISEVLIEIFGDNFGFHWFLPIRVGGFYKFYLKLTSNSHYYFEDEYKVKGNSINQADNNNAEHVVSLQENGSLLDKQILQYQTDKD